MSTTEGKDGCRAPTFARWPVFIEAAEGVLAHVEQLSMVVNAWVVSPAGALAEAASSRRADGMMRPWSDPWATCRSSAASASWPS